VGLANPNNASEILYGSSGDVRNEINAYAAQAGAGHYVDEAEVPASAIIRGLERATRRINGYLEVVYSDQIPVTVVSAVPVLLDDIASDLATYYVWRENAARLRQMTEEKKFNYYDVHVSESKEQPGTLPLIRERKLQIAEFTSSYADEVQAVRGEGQAPIFDVDKETNWEVDTRTLDDIERERNT
jgi:hypothetical protein